MNYLLDKKLKRNKIIKIALAMLLLIFLFYFRAGIAGGLSRASLFIFRPVILLGGQISGNFSDSLTFFRFKESLLRDNENLRRELDTNLARLANYNSILDDNLKMREMLGRQSTGESLVLSAILSKPNQSPYDTLLIDAGTNLGIQTGNLVLALGAIPIGRVAEVYSSSAKVVLFSSWGEKTEVVIAGQDIFMEVIGRGGGNFEMILPREMEVPPGTEILIPGLNSALLGIVETTISDPRDSFKKVLLVSPVNIQELKFVEVKK